MHAQIKVVGDECTLLDEGLSRNGSFVNGERVHGRRHLRDRDTIHFGKTAVLYRRPGDAAPDATAIATELPAIATVSPAQRRVLVSLCRPFKDGAAFATPATNQQISRRPPSQRRRGEDPHARPLREARGGGPAAEPKAGRPGRARAAQRRRLEVRPLSRARHQGVSEPTPAGWPVHPLGPWARRPREAKLAAGSQTNQTGGSPMTRTHTDNAHTTGTKALWAAAVASLAALAMMIAPALGYAKAPVHFGAKLDPTVQPSNSLPAHPCNQLNPGSQLHDDRERRLRPRRRRARSEERHDQEDPADRRRPRQLQAADRRGQAVDAAQHRQGPRRPQRPDDQLPGPGPVQLGLRPTTGSSPSRSTSRSTGASTWRCGASTPRWCAAPPAATTR